MISYLRGQLLGVDEDRIMLEVQGIGYEVAVPSTVLQKLPSKGQELELYTHLHVREDALQLYGFSTPQERAMFRVLINARGIGPKVALTILDKFSADSLAAVLERGEVDPLLKVPGVGKKTAQRLILELKGKLPESFFKDEEKTAEEQVDNEVVQALLALGYSRQESLEALRKIQPRSAEESSTEAVLRLALRELGKKGR
ncbi:MAG: Holliday junction branch migration protein RuvA [Thermacetogeniaceae bacterium]|nr:Holliday junction branch migration protein RuvA [Thermoanaerobacterales bacterium]NLN21534.1 Holliday junction branch migration protein RuvA [Syntrophomonadaceae bacterium]HAF17561.1 Holliday junction branch migration protein RuvA [Peptococcaceae bacterium]